MSYLSRFPTYTHKYLERIPESEHAALIKEYGHLGASAPGVMFDVYLKRKYAKMTITQLRSKAKKVGVYAVWPDGAQKTKEDLINSLVLYQDDPEGFIKKQKRTLGAKEPKIAKRLTVAEMSEDQKALNRLKLDELKTLCAKHNLSCAGKKIDLIDELVNALTSSQIRKIAEAKPKRASPKARRRSKSPPKRTTKVGSSSKMSAKVKECLMKMDKLRLLRFCRANDIPCRAIEGKEGLVREIIRWHAE